MKVLVTGSEGHIGAHVSKKLQAKGYEVIGLDLKLGQHTKNIEQYIDEVPDIIYHLGEYARVSPSFDEPEKVYDQNIVGTFAIVEFWRKHHCKLVYAASSTKLVNANESPYSFTKSTNVDLIKNYANWYGLPYAICYFYNAFGPGETRQGKYATLIGKFEQAYIDKKSLTVVSPGTQKRNFTYVEDLAEGMILAGEKGYGDGYAFNNPNAYSILEIAQAFGNKIEMIDGRPGRKYSGDAPIKSQELGWASTIDVMDWIKTFTNRYQLQHPEQS